MEVLFKQYLGEPYVLGVLLFAAPFVLEEAAILMGGALAADGELPEGAVLLILLAGVIVSDWLLYGIGAAAGSSARVRAFVGEENVARGGRLLRRGMLEAALLAHLVPWLLFPIFVACGFLRVGFARFAIVNAPIAVVYVNVLYWGVYGMNLVLFEWLDDWGYAVAAGLVVIAMLASRRLARRYSDPEPGAARSED